MTIESVNVRYYVNATFTERSNTGTVNEHWYSGFNNKHVSGPFYSREHAEEFAATLAQGNTDGLRLVRCIITQEMED